MATKAGIKTLINGIANSEARLILKAGNFSKISDAIQNMQEGDFDNKPQVNVDAMADEILIKIIALLMEDREIKIDSPTIDKTITNKTLVTTIIINRNKIDSPST